MRSMALALTLASLAMPASVAQSPADVAGVHELSMPISKLNSADRHEILKRLQIVASQLRGEVVISGTTRTFFIQGSGQEQCGATGNCSFWIFDTDHKIMLDGSAQSAKYLEQMHAGRNDVLTTLHDSASELDITYWKFNGKRYRRFRCGTIDYSDPDGNRYEHPLFTAHLCGD
jgi:hypothetical protein